nr:hypothetical protein [Sediminibacterium sp.]
MSKDKKLITNDQLRITNDKNRNSKLAIPNSIIPELRFPEFESAVGWQEAKVDELIHILTPPKKLQ